MIVSVNWLKKYTEIDLPIGELVDLIGSRLVEVESVEDLSKKYKDVVIAQVILAQRIEGSDHLTQTLIDDGGVVEGVERDKNGYVQVVCGATNVKPGMTVAWLPPGAVVPSTYGTQDPFVLEARKLMGVKSQGMIASPRELGLYDEHEGILEIKEDIDPGSYFVDLYGLNDYLLDIENKSLTHRPDVFGVIGFAREVAGIQGKQFESPEWLIKKYPVNNKSELSAPEITIENENAAEKYEVALVEGDFSRGETPDEVKSFLSRVGVRPVSPLVDATNYMMLLSGQPLHAFDYDKLVALCGGEPKITVRYAKEGEILETLDDKTLTLTDSDIVIAADDIVVALAGAIGGKSTKVDDTTKKVLLESATFNLYNLRSTQMRHGIFGEAITRFTKGQPAAQTTPVLISTIALLDKWSNVSGASAVKSVESTTAKESSDITSIAVSLDNINDILFSNYSGEDIKKTLEKVEIKTTIKGRDLIIETPWWRKDLKIKEDIIEEVGRLNGYDNIKTSLPVREFKAVNPIDFDVFKTKVRNLLAKAGGNEVLSYSFVPKKLMLDAGQDSTNAYRIINSISPELEHYRLSLKPSLLKIARMNLKQGYNEFAVFEINKVHAHSRGLTSDGVPIEGYNLAGVVYHKSGTGGSEYYQAKKIVDYLLSKLNIKLKYERLDLDKNSLSMFTPFEPKRSGMLVDPETQELIGVVGEYSIKVKRNFKLPENIAGFEVNLEKLYNKYTKSPLNTYTPAIKYPEVERDLCFQVKKEINYIQLIEVLEGVLREFKGKFTLTPVDIFASSQDPGTKNITIKVRLQSVSGTLTGKEVDMWVEKITNRILANLGGKII